MCDLDFVGGVDDEHPRPFLTLGDRLLGHDDSVDVFADNDRRLDVLAGQDRAVGVGNLGAHEERRGLGVDLIVDEERLADMGMGPFALDNHVHGHAPFGTQRGRDWAGSAPPGADRAPSGRAAGS